MRPETGAHGHRRASATVVLATLSAGQFLMTLDSSVMNVSMAMVASDLGTTITGIQTAITLYTLVMATLMITGGKVGSIVGRRRAFGIGLVVYGCGSLTTALAPNLGVLLVGWSLLEGVGAALIMPAIVALVASNFGPEKRSSAYGLIAASGAVAVAAGPLIGGAVTTFASWRYVFAGEVVLVLLILPVLRRIEDPPPSRARLDLVGSVLSVVGLGLVVYGVLRSGEWGWLRSRTGGPDVLGLSPVFWLILGGMLVVYAFTRWEAHLSRRGREPLLDTRLLRNRQLSGGLTMFFAQFLIQAGVFFTVPLFLSVVLELSALQTGVRLLPLSVALLVAAIGIPRVWPRADPRRVVRLGLAVMTIGIVILAGGMDPGANAGVVAVPMLLMGLGLGALASQLGAVTVSAVPDSRSAEVGGLQNTATNLGASLGTALIGSVLIATLTTSVVAGLQDDPRVPETVREQATTELASGVPFLSDTQLRTALDDADVEPAAAEAVVAANSDARLVALQSALSVAALSAAAALFFTGRIPRRPVGARDDGRKDDTADAPGG
ncbi:MFS transporter [Rhodococcus sp. SGAir0479]|uniref:MFS transporter n=1 Tax=Rhodococcus sp. SGAir0479 TaxID=2567884 RepID=UPI0010CD4588|nr:MFS transporter [Rhodococcus sp. SGAir0479]QCQ92915.1 MFS transporter [Rhodococcus sp. SGAir0479]